MSEEEKTERYTDLLKCIEVKEFDKGKVTEEYVEEIVNDAIPYILNLIEKQREDYETILDLYNKEKEKNETEKLRHYKNGYYAGFEDCENRLKNTKKELEEEYQEKLKNNAVNGFKIKCQIEILKELLENN